MPKKTAKRKATTKRKTTAKRRTTVKRKTTAKRRTTTTTKRKTTANRKPAAKKKLTAIRSAYSKSQTVAEIAETTELSKKEVSAVFEALTDLINRHVKPGGAGQFTLPGLAKIVVQHKKATKARKGINPFTGEPTTFKAKPARNVVKVRPLKKLKEMAAK